MIVDIENLLAKCSVFRANIEKDQIFVVCDTDETFIEIAKRQKEFIQALTVDSESWDEIILRSELGGKLTTFYPPKFRPLIAAKPMVHSSILVIPEAEIISEIMKYPNPSSLVEFSSDRGWFTNTHVEKSSGAKFSEWIGANQGSYWIPEELQRFKQLLLKDKELLGFKYQAFLYTGQKADFEVDARLVTFNGSLCRWVRVVDCQVIS